MTKRSFRIVTSVSDSIFDALLPRIKLSNLERTLASSERKDWRIVRKVVLAESKTAPLSSIQLLISCCNPVNTGIVSFLAMKCGISITSSASKSSIKLRRILLARIVLEISISSIAANMPPICALLADGRTSNIPPIGTLPFTRKMDKPSSISSNSCTTLS